MNKDLIDPSKYMQDAQGRFVPVEMVSDIDQLRDQTVKEIVDGAEEIAGKLAAYKRRVLDTIEAFVATSAERYGVSLGGKKGNITLTSFDGEYKVVRAISEYITFDERLQVAKALIDECIQDWSASSRDEIKVLVNDAFYVDKTGKINTQRILGLRRLNIGDEKWKRAMDAIGEAVTVTGSKTYIRVYKRAGDGSYSQINLDLAGL